MTAPTSDNLPPPETEDLDTRILHLEQRLIARDQRLRSGIDGIRQRAQHMLQPWRRAAPTIGGMLSVTVLGALGWRWLRRGRRRQAVDTAAARRPAADATPVMRRCYGIPWVHLVALGWPMVPAAWRARISPATAGTLVALVLPLVERLLHARRLRPASGG